ncbi:hypothetical protein [Natronorubrum sp. DTA28]|uniref:hypothetical protein n=1 Tax=Natronorubrum sp. DTA28 TaxID=3447019 RepID=UPI003F859B32
MGVERGLSGTESTFEEHQSLPSWLGPALVALSVPALVVALVAVLEAGGPTLRGAGLVVVIVVAVLGPIPLILRSTLRTTVRDDGVYFRFSPFHWSERYISFEEIEAVRRSERRAYQYGLRRTRWGWEYRPNASDGVEIHRTNGPAIFLGSERPHELRQAIEEGVRRTRHG